MQNWPWLRAWTFVAGAALDGLYTGRILRARLHQARGDLDQALCELHGLEQSLQRREFTLLVRGVSIRLAMGDVAATSQYVPVLAASMNAEGPARPPQIVREAFQTLLIRIMLAEGRCEPAGRLLDELQAAAWAGKRFGRLLEVYLLRAQALLNQTAAGALQKAVRWVEMALELGLPEGYVLVFLEEGPWLAPVLEAVTNRQAAPPNLKQYAQRLLTAIRNRGVPIGPAAEGSAIALVEPLTAREIEVLRLLAAGDSNQTIADKLVITVRTVKKHTGNVYGKLNVSSRTQAVAGGA